MAEGNHYDYLFKVTLPVTLLLTLFFCYFLKNFHPLPLKYLTPHADTRPCPLR